MREVEISDVVQEKLAELRYFLTHDYQMSLTAADRRVDRMYRFLHGLSGPADYALCRFERWRTLGYRCISFEGWVFAYETFPEGVIVRDMSHGAALTDTLT